MPHSKSNIISIIEAGQTELWLAPGQGASLIRGRVILHHLSEMGLLESCADLEELKAIQAKGIGFFLRQGFYCKSIVGWRGVRGEIVPYLSEYLGGFIIRWYHLDDGCFGARSPALRRK